MNDFCSPLVFSLGNQVPVTTKDPTPTEQVPAETCNPHLLKYVQKIEKKDKIFSFCTYFFCIVGLLSLAGYLTLTSSWLILLTIPNSSWLGHAPLFCYILCVLTMLFPVGHTDYDDIKCGIFCLGLLPLIIMGVLLMFLPILGVIYFVGVSLVTILPFVLFRKARPEFGTVTFASLCKNNPSNEFIQDWWAYIQTIEKRSDLWTQELEAFLEHVPNSPYVLAYYVRESLYTSESRHRGLSTVDALSLFNRMMTVNKTSFTSELYQLRGDLRLSLNDDAGYEADYLEALKLNPKSPKLLDWDINRSLKKGLHQEALKKTIVAKELCLHENLNDWYTHFLKRETEMQNHCATNIQFPEVTKELRLILEDPTVNELNGEAFERLLKIEFEKQGFTVRNTPVSGDYGVDLILSTPASFTSIAVQVKRSSSSVGVNAVQEVVGGMAHYNCTKGMVITNAKFTKQAHALAASNSIHLIHVASAISVKRNETNDQFNETHYECPNEWRLERNGNNGQFNAKGQYGAGVDALADVDMSPYVSTVQRRINQNWLPSQELSSLTSEYTLVISRTGALLNYRLKRSSGNALFEELATSAITATNFPPLPTGYRGEYITIDFYFDYEACP